MEKLVARVLNWGVSISFIIILGGLLLALGRGIGDLHLAESQPGNALNWDVFTRDLGGMEPRAIIALGLGALALTPAARVGFALAAFVRQRDWVYAGIAAFTLGMLILGLAIGRAR